EPIAGATGQNFHFNGKLFSIAPPRPARQERGAGLTASTYVYCEESTDSDDSRSIHGSPPAWPRGVGRRPGGTITSQWEMPSRREGWRSCSSAARHAAAYRLALQLRPRRYVRSRGKNADW